MLRKQISPILVQKIGRTALAILLLAAAVAYFVDRFLAGTLLLAAVVVWFYLGNVKGWVDAERQK